MVDRLLVDEVVERTRQDPKLAYQRLDPWVRNACQRMKKGTFQHGLFVGGLERNLVADALKPYGVTPRDVAKETRTASAKGLAKGIEGLARRQAKKSESCRKFVSEEAKYYRRQIGVDPTPEGY